MKNSSEQESGTKQLFLKIVPFVIIFALFLIGLSIFLNPQKQSVVHVENNSSRKIAVLQKIPDRSEIVFGCSISKTGRFIVEGENVIQGYDFWKEHANKNGGIKIGNKAYKVRIKYYDDKSQIEILKKNIIKLIVEDKVDFILGPFTSGFNLAASIITEKYGKIMIESGGASDSIFTRNQNFTFATQTSASWWFKDFFDMVSQLTRPPKTYALLTPDKLFTRSVAKGVQIWAASKNIKEVYFEIVAKETNNFLPYLLEMVKKQPDIVILTSHYQDAVVFSTQLANVKELHPKAVVMTIGPSEIDFIKDVGKDAEGLIGVTQWVAENNYTGRIFGTPRYYVQEFTKKYGEAPTY